jgi:hypothetical protein
VDEILELPAPRTEAGARQLHVALDAHARRERWGSRRRVATAAAALGSIPLVLGDKLGLVGPGWHQAALALWWTAVGMLIVSTAGTWWWAARLARAVSALGGSKRAC